MKRQRAVCACLFLLCSISSVPAASDPQPVNGAASVPIDANLSWSAGIDVTSHDVYFGDIFPPPFVVNQTTTTFDPCDLLANSTIYYWRIDEHYTYGVTEGEGWSFTTRDRLDIALDAVSSARDTDGGGTTLTFSHTIGDGNDRVLVVGTGAEDDLASDLVISSVRYNDVAMTSIAGSSITASTSGATWLMKTDMYYLLDANLPPPGTYPVSIVYAGNVLDRSAGAISLFNVRQSGPEATATSTEPNGQTISTVITTQTAGAWVIDVVGSGDPGTFIATATGQTERWDISPDTSSTAGSTRFVAAPGQTTMSWQHNTPKRMAHSLAAFAPVEPYVLLDGDLDQNGAVDLADLGEFAGQWPGPGCPPEDLGCADLDGSGTVTFADFALLAGNWRL